MTKLEEIARAICWKNGMNPDLTLGGDGENFLWMEYKDQARAAVLALREPTAEMLSAAIVSEGDGNLEVDARNTWQAMIDEVLK